MSEDPVVTVLPDVAGVAKSLAYRWPSRLGELPPVGTLVSIPLNSRKIRGWLMAISTAETFAGKLREVMAVRGSGPPPGLVETCNTLARHYLCSPTYLLGLASPPSALPKQAGGLRPLPSSSLNAPVKISGISHALTLLWCPPDGSGTQRGVEIAGEVLEMGRSVVICLPTMSRVEGFLARCRERGLPAFHHTREWYDIRDSQSAVVVVGSRAAVFAPREDLGAILVIDGQDFAMRESQAPYYETWELSQLRAMAEGCPAVQISTAPLLSMVESSRVAKVSAGAYHKGWARVNIHDPTENQNLLDPLPQIYRRAPVPPLLPSPGGISARLVVVVNHKGFARRVKCRRCGGEPSCENCAAPLVGVGEGDAQSFGSGVEDIRRKNTLVGTRCVVCRVSYPPLCTSCGSPELSARGKGAAKIAGELEGLLHVRVHSAITGAGESSCEVVVDTESTLLGELRAGAVVFLDFDQVLSHADLEASVLSEYLLARASEAVFSSGGSIEIFTRRPLSAVVQASVKRNLDDLYRTERAQAQDFGLPPYRALVRLGGPAATDIVTRLEGYGDLFEIAEVTKGVFTVAGSSRDELLAALAPLQVGLPASKLKVEFQPRRI